MRRSLAVASDWSRRRFLWSHPTCLLPQSCLLVKRLASALAATCNMCGHVKPTCSGKPGESEVDCGVEAEAESGVRSLAKVEWRGEWSGRES